MLLLHAHGTISFIDLLGMTSSIAKDKKATEGNETRKDRGKILWYRGKMIWYKEDAMVQG